MTKANAYTAVRVAAAPVFFVLYMLPVWTGRFAAASAYILVPLFAYAEFTDFLDGRAARKEGQVSSFGKLFDPFADVILNLSAFFALTLSGYMPAVFLLLIVYREMSMTFLRAVAAVQGLAIGARKGGKAKTFFYVLSISFNLALEFGLRTGILPALPGALKFTGQVMLGICVLLAYISFIDYLAAFGNVFKGKK
jgi:CDP-diacylglycerol--glycerol-3-phosphate 3-phosphatidyltransferase